jgi:hypothetical protein
MIKLSSMLNESDNFVYKVIDFGKIYFLPFNGRPSSNGWKLSLQGKTTDDAKQLYDLLGSWLQSNNIPFKVGTVKLINNAKRPEQRTKLLTIYVPDGEDLYEFMERVYKKVKSYKGWHNIKPPRGYEHYAGPIFFRNDRDEEGNYVRP